MSNITEIKIVIFEDGGDGGDGIDIKINNKDYWLSAEKSFANYEFIKKHLHLLEDTVKLLAWKRVV